MPWRTLKRATEVKSLRSAPWQAFTLDNRTLAITLILGWVAGGQKVARRLNRQSTWRRRCRQCLLVT
jgi:hypothetical protein